MPFIRFYTSPGQLTAAEKQDLATVFTARYAKAMPAFFATVMFHEIPEDSYFVGGVKTEGTFVRLTMEHIAINFDREEKGDQMSKNFLAFVGEELKNRFESRGWRWEFNILNTDKKYWRIQGFEMPPLDSETMKVWKTEQKASAWQ
ncbi:hypothetical protein LCER1_G009022 [Lachnellula cervina]|uniref:Tautomerase cis-CaaD-like domain-containing protein n=1 Tax=Lachnellula cervina TaxID=1316786 RepID=A0A7D8ULI6_9HELO|nr:hypothetical protein LCER1_G009022 [Lachnellula cervina]